MTTIFLPKLILTLVLFISSVLVTHAQYVGQNCYDGFGTYRLISDYESNINKSITQLSSFASTSYFNTISVGTGNDKVNALFYCRYDVSNDACQSCVTNALNNVSSCFLSVEGFIIYQECSIHYSNRSIFSVMEDLPQMTIYGLNTVDDSGDFKQLLATTISSLISDTISEFATSSRFFGTAIAKYSSSESIYAIAQCAEDITSSDCRTCLQGGFGNFTSEYGDVFIGQIFTPSCRLSYKLSSKVLSTPFDFTVTIISNTTLPPALDTPLDLAPSSMTFPPDDGLSPMPSLTPLSILNPPSTFDPNLSSPFPSKPGFQSAGKSSMSTMVSMTASIASVILSMKLILSFP